jgi:hypothetical protein
MRHLLSVVLSIVLAPLIYIAAGLAAIKLDAAHITSTDINWAAAGIGLGAGLAAGALYAVLVMTRLSPLGPVLAALLYLGATIWAFLNQASFAKALDFNLLGVKHVLLQPVGAGTLLLAVPLFATVFSRRRWSSPVETGLPYDASPDYPPSPGSAAPAYDEPPTLVTPTYGGYSSEPGGRTETAETVYTPGRSSQDPPG